MYGWKPKSDEQLILVGNDLKSDISDIIGAVTYKINPLDIFIGGINIRKKYQGKKYGNLLIDALVKLAKDLGIKEIKLYVAGGASNEQAIHFYEKYGFFLDRNHPEIEHLAIEKLKDFLINENPELYTEDVPENVIDDYLVSSEETLDDWIEEAINDWYPMKLII